MELFDLAVLVAEVAHELREDSRVARAGKECGLTEAELIFQGDAGDYAGAIVFRGSGDQDSINRERTLEEAADVFARFLRNLRHWASFARRHGLTEVFVSAKRFAGATNRDLYTRDEPSRVIPDDPMVLF